MKNGLVRYNSRQLLTRSPEPVREQLRHILLAEIDRGTFLRGAKLPSERELAERFGTSRTTVRQAIEYLVEAGTLVRSAGKGTFVAGATPAHSLPGAVSGDRGPRVRSGDARTLSSAKTSLSLSRWVTTASSLGCRRLASKAAIGCSFMF